MCAFLQFTFFMVDCLTYGGFYHEYIGLLLGTHWFKTLASKLGLEINPNASTWNAVLCRRDKTPLS